MTSQKNTLIFVFGTLKRGYRANDKLKDQPFLGSAITIPRYKMFDVGFPMIFKNVTGHQVKGEVYLVSPGCLSDMDYYEGYPSFYQREEIDVTLLDPVAGGPDERKQMMRSLIYYNKDSDYDEYMDRNRVQPDSDGSLCWG